MSYFLSELKKHKASETDRRWLYIPYDQLSDEIGPLSREPADELGIILIESTWKAFRRPYHKQKLALILSNMRHFALEQAERGVAVRYLFSSKPYADVLRELDVDGPIQIMEPAEYELRRNLKPLVDDGTLEVISHEGWLSTRAQFEASQKSDTPPWRMDTFYRHLRQKTGILMQDDKPEGGKYSFDAENREPWSGDPPAAEPPTFPVDDIKEEVSELIQKLFPDHPGEVDLEHLPATKDDAEQMWHWAREQCLPTYGPYEDAMSQKSTTLFHTRISSLLNIHRLLPQRVVDDVAEMEIPLPSKEGFIRQVLGWREFVRHVHAATDGFRTLPNVRVADKPGDGGYARWQGQDWSASENPEGLDGGAAPAELGGDTPLPAAFWSANSGLHCLDTVVASVWQEGYGHHITRLMVLANLATLLDVSPRALTDWFWVAYTDAYDWVVEPNVLGMGTFAVGDVMSTKPYVSGAAYINKMSDFCASCQFDPADDCPITSLYWAFLNRHREQLKDNPRMRMMLATAKRRSGERRKQDEAVFETVRETLSQGEALSVSSVNKK